jgi:hypothetical protein
MTKPFSVRNLALVLAGMLAGALFLPTSVGASITTLKPPAIPGVVALPGPVAAPATPSLTMGFSR